MEHGIFLNAEQKGLTTRPGGENKNTSFLSLPVAETVRLGRNQLSEERAREGTNLEPGYTPQ